MLHVVIGSAAGCNLMHETLCALQAMERAVSGDMKRVSEYNGELLEAQDPARFHFTCSRHAAKCLVHPAGNGEGSKW